MLCPLCLHRRRVSETALGCRPRVLSVAQSLELLAEPEGRDEVEPEPHPEPLAQTGTLMLGSFREHARGEGRARGADPRDVLQGTRKVGKGVEAARAMHPSHGSRGDRQAVRVTVNQ